MTVHNLYDAPRRCLYATGFGGVGDDSYQELCKNSGQSCGIRGLENVETLNDNPYFDEFELVLPL